MQACDSRNNHSSFQIKRIATSQDYHYYIPKDLSCQEGMLLFLTYLFAFLFSKKRTQAINVIIY